MNLDLNKLYYDCNEPTHFHCKWCKGSEILQDIMQLRREEHRSWRRDPEYRNSRRAAKLKRLKGIYGNPNPNPKSKSKNRKSKNRKSKNRQKNKFNKTSKKKRKSKNRKKRKSKGR